RLHGLPGLEDPAHRVAATHLVTQRTGPGGQVPQFGVFAAGEVANAPRRRLQLLGPAPGLPEQLVDGLPHAQVGGELAEVVEIVQAHRVRDGDTGRGQPYRLAVQVDHADTLHGDVTQEAGLLGPPAAVLVEHGDDQVGERGTPRLVGPD